MLERGVVKAASDVKLVLRLMQKESGKLKEATCSGFLALCDSFEYSGENISECSLLLLRRSVYMPIMEVQESPVFEVEQSRMHRQKCFQTIYCNPPEGGGSITANHGLHFQCN